jgi:hypothetical protein
MADSGLLCSTVVREVRLFLMEKQHLVHLPRGTPIVNPLYRAFLVAVYEGYRDSEK